MSPTTTRRRIRKIADLNARIKACRRCHELGFLHEPESVPIVRDPDPQSPPPRVLLVGQAPGLKASVYDRPFAGISGDKLRGWLDRGGIAPEDFWRKIHIAAVTRCYPGRLPGAKGDRVPSPREQAVCRPWLDEVVATVRPEVVLLVGLLAARAFYGPVPSLQAVVGTGTVAGGVRYLALPHPSGVSRWLNEPANVAAVGRSMDLLRAWVEELGI